MFSQSAEIKVIVQLHAWPRDLDEWDAGFRQTTSKTPVPTHYGLSIYLGVVFWKGLQGPHLAGYPLW